MKSFRLLFWLAASMVLLSCANKPATTEKETNAQVYNESIINSFNEHSYDFSLDYINGHYVLLPEITIPGEEIKTLINGKDWTVCYDGIITLDGLRMEVMDGAPEIIYSFRQEKVHVVSIPNEPTQPNDDYNEDVSVTDNVITSGKDTLIVCSLNEGRPIYVQSLYNSARWMYNHLEQK